MTCFTTRHIQAGVRATFFNSEGAKINDSLGLPGIGPPGYAPARQNLVIFLFSHKDDKTFKVIDQ